MEFEENAIFPGTRVSDFVITIHPWANSKWYYCYVINGNQWAHVELYVMKTGFDGDRRIGTIQVSVLGKREGLFSEVSIRDGKKVPLLK